MSTASAVVLWIFVMFLAYFWDNNQDIITHLTPLSQTVLCLSISVTTLFGHGLRHIILIQSIESNGRVKFLHLVKSVIIRMSESVMP